MDALDVVDDDVDWSQVIKDARGKLSRPELSQRIKAAGVTEISAASITAYERGQRFPGPTKAKALDDALGTGRRIQTACGYHEPDDLDVEFSKLRERVRELEQIVGQQRVSLEQMTVTVELLSREVWPPEDPPAPPPHD